MNREPAMPTVEMIPQEYLDAVQERSAINPWAKAKFKMGEVEREKYIAELLKAGMIDEKMANKVRKQMEADAIGEPMDTLSTNKKFLDKAFGK